MQTEQCLCKKGSTYAGPYRCARPNTLDYFDQIDRPANLSCLVGPDVPAGVYNVSVRLGAAEDELALDKAFFRQADW